MRVRYCKPTTGKAEKQPEPKRASAGGRQMLQLGICVVLFFTVFIGKGAFPDRVAQVGPQLLGVIRSNTDFRAAFASLGSAMTDNQRIPEGVREFCVSVFGIQTADTQQLPPESIEVLQPEPVIQEESEPVLEPEPEPIPEYQVGDVVETIAVEGEALPADYTYDKLYLGELMTGNPVEGRLTSAFGYRDHPTIGRYAVHAGVDIGAAAGSTVRAFADATVEFVGENEDYGLYLQLKHANHISTFYSHCQSIGVKAGETVTVGQPIAQVGSTGKSTGPHLHFEVHLGDVRLDPMHYITLREG